MSESVRQAASSALQGAREGYWFNREQKQLRAAEDGLRQVDELVRQGGDPGEVQVVRLARAAAEAADTTTERLESLCAALDVLSAGAAAGVGPQAALAVRLLSQANRQRVLDELVAMAPAGDPVARLAPHATSLATSRTLLQGLAEGHPTSAADEAALVLRLDHPHTALDGLIAAWKPAEAALYEEARQAGLQDAVAVPLLQGLAGGQVDRLAVLADSVHHLQRSSAESLATLAARKRSPWQKVLQQALAADPAIREPLCRALLERIKPDTKGDAELLLSAAIQAGRELDGGTPAALATLALDAADRARPAAKGWHAALRGAVQAAPETASRAVEALACELPSTAREAADQAASLVDAASLDDGAVAVAAALAPEVERLAAASGDAAVRQAAGVVTTLAALPYTSGGTGLVQRALGCVPDAEDPPLASVDPTFYASTARSVLFETVSAKDRELAAFALLDGLAQASTGGSQLRTACDVVRNAAGALRADHAQRAEVASALFEALGDLESAADVQLDELVRRLAGNENLDESVRADLVRTLLGPCADGLRQAGEGRAAERLDLLNRLVSLDLDGDSVRLGLVSQALYHELPEARLGLVPQCLGGQLQGAVWADREALLAEGLRMATQLGTPEQGRLLGVMDGLLDTQEAREGLLNLLERAPEGDGLGWACSLSTMLLDEVLAPESAVAFWDGLSAELVKGRGPGDVLGQLLSQGRRDVASAEDDYARLEVIRAVLERVRLVYEDEALRGVARPDADPGEIEVGEEQVTIGGVSVPRR